MPQGDVGIEEVILIQNFYFHPSLSFGENATAGLGQDVNTHATSCVTLVFDDDQHWRAHKDTK